MLPSTDMRLKQRIVRILVHEIIADVDEKTNDIVLSDALDGWSSFRVTGQEERSWAAQSLHERRSHRSDPADVR